MDASQIVLTAEGRKKLEEELAYLEGEKSREIVEHIKEARAFGDLSENAEYDAAKEDQARNAARIAEIRATLANAQDAVAGSSMIVSIGSTVTLVDGDGEVSDFSIVGTTETNVPSTRSPTSPRSAAPSSVTARARASRSFCRTARRRVYTIAKIFALGFAYRQFG